METSEVKSTSRRVRLWARLSDPDKRPRRWWFPPSSRRDKVRHIPDAARQDYQKSMQQAHEKFSETVRLAMLSLLGFALFCLLITLSASDSTLLVADPTIKMPFADVQVSFQSFLILAPFLLIIITLYLHIFYGYWLDLETDYQHLTHSREPSEPPLEHLPTLFALDHPVPRLLTAFIFYWLVPLVLVTITWKAAVRFEWGLPLMFISSLVTAVLVFLKIRRCPASQRQRNRWRWLVMLVIIAWLVALIFNPQWLKRQWNIFRADLKGKWLVSVDLHHADASLANLQGADLRGANLQGADLRGADLQGANLDSARLQDARLWEADLRGANLDSARLQGAALGFADLRGARLVGAHLEGADLWGVFLQGADLGFADLRGANLQDAHLGGADLQGAKLQGAKLQGAKLQGAKLQEVKNLIKGQIQDADLQGADLRGVNLEGVNLQGANLQGANLRGTRLKRAHLEGTALSLIRLKGGALEVANLQDADLRGTMLQGAKLQGAKLQGTMLQEVKDLTEAQIQSAHIDERTILPDYLKRPKPAEPDEAAPPPAGTTPIE